MLFFYQVFTCFQHKKAFLIIFLLCQMYFFYNTDRKDPPYDVRGYPISSSMVNITWKIPSGYKTVYFAVHVFNYMRKADFQEVTSDHATYFVLKDLRPYTEYVICVKMYADERARGESAAIPVRTLETSG